MDYLHFKPNNEDFGLIFSLAFFIPSTMDSFSIERTFVLL